MKKVILILFVTILCTSCGIDFSSTEPKLPEHQFYSTTVDCGGINTPAQPKPKKILYLAIIQETETDPDMPK